MYCVTGRKLRYVQMLWDEFEKRVGRESTLMFRFITPLQRRPAAVRAEVKYLAVTIDAYLRRAGWGGWLFQSRGRLLNEAKVSILIHVDGLLDESELVLDIDCALEIR